MVVCVHQADLAVGIAAQVHILDNVIRYILPEEVVAQRVVHHLDRLVHSLDLLLRVAEQQLDHISGVAHLVHLVG